MYTTRYTTIYTTRCTTMYTTIRYYIHCCIHYYLYTLLYATRYTTSSIIFGADKAGQTRKNSIFYEHTGAQHA